MSCDPATDLPLRAMTCGLAEMQLNLMEAALPLFDGRVNRFMVYALLSRRTFDRGRPIPVLSIADSLGLPFETTRRHIAALTERGWCRRERGGVALTGTLEEGPVATLAPLAHDCLVRFVSDLRMTGTMPAFEQLRRPYSWLTGWHAATDLLLAVADSNNGTHRDRVNLVLFSTILCANSRPLTADPILCGRYAALRPSPPAALVRPIRAKVLGELMSMPKATLRRRLCLMMDGPIRQEADGLVVVDEWMATSYALETGVKVWGNVRRCLAVLGMHGFPLDAPESAYRVGRPPLVCFS